MTSKKWCIGFLLLCTALMLFLGGITAYIDPYFHYHAPLKEYEYPIHIARYQNDGIGKHFDYDAIITGTSMTENFRASELNDLFGVETIKIPFSGATYKEVNENLRRALKANPDVKMIVRSLDGYMLFEEKDKMRTDAKFPNYLYDSNPLNDVEYLLNKEILINGSMRVLEYTEEGNRTTTFDEYCFWGDSFEYRAENVIRANEWVAESAQYAADQWEIEEADAATVEGNVLQNAAAIAEENPNVQFYYYFPPYSIVWWYGKYYGGGLLEQVQAYEIASEVLLEYENVHLYSFSDDFDVITDLNNYKDLEHHSDAINSKILADMREGNFLLTKDNYKAHWQEVLTFYSEFDYDSHFAPYLTVEE